MGAVSYTADSADDFDELVTAIGTAANAAGWTRTIGPFMDGGNPAGGADAGTLLELTSGNDFHVAIRSVANLRQVSLPAAWAGGLGPNIDGPGALIRGVFDDGVDPSAPPGGELTSSKYIGPQPVEVNNTSPNSAWRTVEFPADYHIFVMDEPDMIVVVLRGQPSRYQWLIFGEVVKFGDWGGGGFYGGSGTTRQTSGGSFPSQAGYSVSGSSTNRSFAPWHRMQARFNQGENPVTVSNTVLHCDTGTTETEIDDQPWTQNAVGPGIGSVIYREAITNVFLDPINQRSPNPFNQVSVMVPYWLATQREGHRVIIGRVPHIRHMPIDNFNAGDVFQLGNDHWMVFPYFERTPGLTGRFGWAIRKAE